MSISRKRLGWLSALVALLLVAIMEVAVPQNIAHAASHLPTTAHYCTGNPPCPGIDGTDPYSSGCAGGNASYKVLLTADIVDSDPYDFPSPTKVGYVQLWYSGTCNTNWTRVVSTTQYGTPGFSPPTAYLLEAWVGRWINGQKIQLNDVSCTICTSLISPQYYIPSAAYATGGIRPYGMAQETTYTLHQ